MAAKNCWEFKKCGRELGGIKAKEMGLCPANPHHGRDCWMVAGTFCGGKVQGTYAQKNATCMECEWFKHVRSENKEEVADNKNGILDGLSKILNKITH